MSIIWQEYYFKMAKIQLKKNLSERILERSKQKNLRAQNRSLFLALRPEIIQALKDGWPVKLIWETLYEEKRISFSYQSLTYYVNQLIYADEKTDKFLSEESTPETTKESENLNKKSSNKIKGFNYNPVPNKEDLF